MKYTRGLISFIVIAMVVGVGFFVLSTDQVKANGGCLLTIEKVATPANNVPFLFSVTGDEPFTLMDPGNTTTNIEIDLSDTITITEEAPAGWELGGIECVQGTITCGAVFCLNITIDEATNSITAECIDGDEGSCTFTNVLTPRTGVPTLSQWGLISLIVILGIVGFIFYRRRATA